MPNLTLSEILANTKTLAKEHKKPDAVHHKIEHRKEKGKEHHVVHHKKKEKPMYPEMKLKDVAEKKASGFIFKSAKPEDLKAKDTSNIVSIKLPKLGEVPFVMTAPVTDDTKTSKPKTGR